MSETTQDVIILKCEICGKLLTPSDYEIERHFKKIMDFDFPMLRTEPVLTGMSFYHKSCREKKAAMDGAPFPRRPLIRRGVK